MGMPAAKENDQIVALDTHIVLIGGPPVPTGRSAGSLQVVAVSPSRAAPLLLMRTVELPLCTVALLAGGL